MFCVTLSNCSPHVLDIRNDNRMGNSNKLQPLGLVRIFVVFWESPMEHHHWWRHDISDDPNKRLEENIKGRIFEMYMHSKQYNT